MFWSIFNYFFGRKTSPISEIAAQSVTPSAEAQVQQNQPVVQPTPTQFESEASCSQPKVVVTIQEQIQNQSATIQDQPITIQTASPFESAVEDYSKKNIIISEGNTVQIRKFVVSKMRKHSNILVIGKRMSGKTTLVKYLMKHCKLERGLAIGQSFTDVSTSDLDMPLDNLVFKDEYKPKIIESFINALKAVKNNPDRALILDDCVYDPKSWNNNSELKWLFMNNRFVRTTLLVSTAHYGIPPTCRANVDYVFLLNEPSVQRKRQLYDRFGGIAPTYAIFEHIMNKCTSDYGCLVIDNTSRSGKIEDSFFWLTCTP